MKIKPLLITALSLTSIICVAESQNNSQKNESSENTQGVNYHLSKHTVSSGGGLISGGIYVVTSSIGQIDAGHQTNGKNYQFNGGLLAQSGNDLIFRNSFE